MGFFVVVVLDRLWAILGFYGLCWEFYGLYWLLNGR